MPFSACLLKQPRTTCLGMAPHILIDSTMGIMLSVHWALQFYPELFTLWFVLSVLSFLKCSHMLKLPDQCSNYIPFSLKKKIHASCSYFHLWISRVWYKFLQSCFQVRKQFRNCYLKVACLQIRLYSLTQSSFFSSLYQQQWFSLALSFSCLLWLSILILFRIFWMFICFMLADFFKCWQSINCSWSNTWYM